MNYRKYIEFRKRLKKIGQISDPEELGSALERLTHDMKQNGFLFPIVYRRPVTSLMQMIEKDMQTSRISKRQRIRSVGKDLALLIGIVVGVITIICFIIKVWHG